MTALHHKNAKMDRLAIWPVASEIAKIAISNFSELPKIGDSSFNKFLLFVF